MRTHSFYFSGNAKNKHEFGTGFIVDKSIDHVIIGFVPINKYMCTLRLKTKKFKVSLLNVHAPTETKEDATKDEFYAEIEQILNQMPSTDVKILLGDFNAQIGKENCFRSVVGNHSLHDLSNDNGCRVCTFAMSNGLVIKSTQFERKDIHKVTWTSNDGRTRTQIDHVLIDGKFSSNIIDVRSYRGTLHESDHALVKIRMRARWPRRNVGDKNVRPKFNVEKLKDDETVTKYRRKIESLIEQQNDDDLSSSEMVRQNNEIIKQAADEVLGRTMRNRSSHWFDDECQRAVEERKVERLKGNTRSKVAAYKRKRIQVYRLLRRKKREHLNQEISNLEASNRNGNVRDFYKMTKQQRKQFQPRSIKINDEHGQLLSDEKEIANRWGEYFHDLLNKPTIQRPQRTFQNAEPMIETPTYEEVTEAIHKLKPNKSPGDDNIPAELIKAAGPDLWHRLHQIVNRVWDEERVPEDWQMGLLIPIFKKGARVECKNYRGICLLNVAYKVLAEILYSRLEIYAEEITGDYQCGFRRGRSTTDQIFTIRQIMEKAWEYNVTIHQLFLDFKQAYDSIDRQALFGIMEEFGIPKKLINLTKATLTDTKCKVLILNVQSDPFDINTGLRQGDKLSTILFNLALEKVTRAMTVNWNGTIFTSSKQVTAFADDADLMGRGTIAIKEMFVEMDREAETIGLKISEDKTKYLTLDRKQGSRIGQNITIDDYNFEVVQSFRYLGSIINTDNDVDEEIKTRLMQGNRCFYALKHLFRNSLVSRNTKLRLYKTLIRPIVMYGCETWSLTQRQESQFNCFERRVLRSICGPLCEQGRWRIRTNRELTEIYGDETLVGAIKSARLRWAGHVARMDEDRMPKKVMDRNFDNNRSRGRPRKRWLDGVEEDARKLDVGQWRSLAQDRSRWRNVVESAKTRLG